MIESRLATGWLSLLLALAPLGLSAQTVTTLAVSLSGSGDLAVGPDGQIYVADFGQFLSNANGTTLSRITLDGQVSVFASGFNGASGNEFDADGNLIQANIAGNRIDRVAPDGTVTTLAQSGFSQPRRRCHRGRWDGLRCQLRGQYHLAGDERRRRGICIRWAAELPQWTHGRS